jgi:hypothetical protein
MLSPAGVILLIAILLLPVGWIVSEFRGSRSLRLLLGCSAILMSFGVAFIVGSLERFSANAWFSKASKQLIDASISELEAGRSDRVLIAWRELQAEFRPTYERRGRYDTLVKKAVSKMTSDETPQPVAPHEPPPRASVSGPPDDPTLDSLPASGSGGGR